MGVGTIIVDDVWAFGRCMRFWLALFEKTLLFLDNLYFVGPMLLFIGQIHAEMSWRNRVNSPGAQDIVVLECRATKNKLCPLLHKQAEASL
jgi:hypothetical protein